MDTDLSGRTALITGGSMGLGLAMAEAFYRSGAKVAILARRQEPIDEACRALRSGSGEPTSAVLGCVCDVTDANAVDATLARVTGELGPVDILVNNAGKSAAKPFVEISDEEWQSDIDLKLFAAIRLTRLVWGHMEEQRWGRIINLLNVYAKAPDARTAPTSGVIHCKVWRFSCPFF